MENSSTKNETKSTVFFIPLLPPDCFLFAALPDALPRREDTASSVAVTALVVMSVLVTAITDAVGLKATITLACLEVLAGGDLELAFRCPLFGSSQISGMSNCGPRLNTAVPKRGAILSTPCFL